MILATANVACSETFPPNVWEFTKDYYDVYGEPSLSASVIGDLEFENGETSRIFIRLTNEGEIIGFENERMPITSNESMDAQKELHLEDDITTAINIQATLENNNNNNEAPVKISSGLVHGGFLRSGESSKPLGFDIEIFNNAPSGTYKLNLSLTYQYQKEVQVEGYPDEELDLWYITKNQTLPIFIKVKPDVDLVVENVRSELMPEKEGMVYITYKNTGTETAEDAVASISVTDPFTTIDDREFLGTLKPGDSYEAQYRIEVDKTAMPKTYWVETEVEYKDRYGGASETGVLKAPVNVGEKLSLGEKIGMTGTHIGIAGVLGVIGVGIYAIRIRKKNESR
ncbi:MAG TPA: hypothetical protein C5S51_11680 [Methanosarcinaceae archaeon]|nr:hypothetical protein [Methanosarcinaceae archaeon]